ncbi:hypothetical protein ACQP1G_30495 [Nocardia sp. CA-107356]|uniref:hypothetical protein n=1 Tax=Nocardia sp. CA-107356 TaxID=3239972 RepID=UPI003D931E7F
MAEQRRVRVDTTRLRQAAGKMDEVGRKTAEIMSTLRNTLQSKSYPWGHDDYGDKFVTGDKGYGNSSKNLLDGGDNMARSGKKFGDGMSGAADKMDKMDSGA